MQIFLNNDINVEKFWIGKDTKLSFGSPWYSGNKEITFELTINNLVDLSHYALIKF